MQFFKLWKTNYCYSSYTKLCMPGQASRWERSLQFKSSANLDAPESGVIISNNPLQQIVWEVFHVTSTTKFLDTREGWLPAGLRSCVQSVPMQLCACLPQHVHRQATPLCAQLCRDAVSCSRTWARTAHKGLHQSLAGRKWSAHLHGTKYPGYLHLCRAPWLYWLPLGSNCNAMLSESETGNVL